MRFFNLLSTEALNLDFVNESFTKSAVFDSRDISDVISSPMICFLPIFAIKGLFSRVLCNALLHIRLNCIQITARSLTHAL